VFPPGCRARDNDERVLLFADVSVSATGDFGGDDDDDDDAIVNDCSDEMVCCDVLRFPLGLYCYSNTDRFLS
jgi:hypothetical protein